MSQKERIELDIECPECGGTGIYSGMAESSGVGVVCYKCNGTGKFHYSYSYTPFKERKIAKGIQRVYRSGMGYKIGLGVIDYQGVGPIDMDKEGVSYKEFLQGEMPGHIEKLGCPMMADQGACHQINGFTAKCNEYNGRWLSLIPSCKHKCRKSECWERFKKGVESNAKKRDQR